MRPCCILSPRCRVSSQTNCNPGWCLDDSFEEGLRTYYCNRTRWQSWYIRTWRAAANDYGFPRGTTIYFAVDYDAVDEGVTDRIILSFRTLASRFVGGLPFPAVSRLATMTSALSWASMFKSGAHLYSLRRRPSIKPTRLRHPPRGGGHGTATSGHSRGADMSQRLEPSICAQSSPRTAPMRPSPPWSRTRSSTRCR
jgi:Domain of unknown function (DUF1906)